MATRFVYGDSYTGSVFNTQTTVFNDAREGTGTGLPLSAFAGGTSNMFAGVQTNGTTQYQESQGGYQYNTTNVGAVSSVSLLCSSAKQTAILEAYAVDWG